MWCHKLLQKKKKKKEDKVFKAGMPKPAKGLETVGTETARLGESQTSLRDMSSSGSCEGIAGYTRYRPYSFSSIFTGGFIGISGAGEGLGDC